MLVHVTRWHGVDPVDEDFFTSAPHVFRYTKRFAAPVEKVWESLASDESLAAWSATVSAVNWSSPRPFGVGTTREVVLAPGLTRMRERFFRWDEGRGYSFAAYEANLPVFRSFAEDYVLEALEPGGTGGAGGGATRLTWTVALEPRSALRLPFLALAPVLRLAFGRTVADGERYFARG